MSEYWTICAEEALDEAGFDASPEQVATIARFMESGHAGYADQHGHVEASKSLWADMTRRAEAAEANARREAEKIPCPVCAGKRVSTFNGEMEPAWHQCWNCNQTGKVDP